MPRMVVRMKPDGSLSPGIINLAITPAMKPMMIVQRILISNFLSSLLRAFEHVVGSASPISCRYDKKPSSRPGLVDGDGFLSGCCVHKGQSDDPGNNLMNR